MLQAVRGTKDILPDETREWNMIESKARELFGLYDYNEIRTPIFEKTDLFIKSIGDATDIVEKEMYTFIDQGNRSLTLRPEATAPVVRAALEHHLFNQSALQKLFYIGPMFRQERPQSGRQRQFHQIGIEYLGTDHPTADAETIIVLYRFLSQIGLADVGIKINSVGCAECKKKYSSLLRDTLAPHKEALCELCKNRFSRNVFRILDCKRESCQNLVKNAPSLVETLCQGCHDHYSSVQALLTENQVPYTCTPHLVRGLDYYTRTVYEVTHHELGAKDALAAGGRYDNLIASMGGPDLGAVGFGIGLERTLLARKKQPPIEGESPVVFFVSLGETAYKENFNLCQTLLDNNIKASLDQAGRSIKAQMRKANKLNARFCLIRGDDELQDKSIVLRNMANSEEITISQDHILDEIKKRIQKEQPC